MKIKKKVQQTRVKLTMTEKKEKRKEKKMFYFMSL